MRHAMYLLALVCALPTTSLAQQAPLPLKTGDRVKLAAQAGAPMTIANVLDVRDDAISIVYLGGESNVIDRPFVGIDSIRVSQGSSRVSAAKFGGAFGAFLIGSAGLVTAPLAAKSMGWGVGQSIMAFGVSGALAGGTVGGLIGSLLPRERWKTYVFRHVEAAPTQAALNP